MSLFKIHTYCDYGWTIENRKITDNLDNTTTYSAYICCENNKVHVSFLWNNANIQDSYFIDKHTTKFGDDAWQATYKDDRGNMYTVYFSYHTGLTKKLTPGFPHEGEGTFTFSYTVTTADWNSYGPNSGIQNPWTGIPFINSDNSLTFSMSTTEVGTDTEVTITVKSAGTRSPLTGLNFYGTGTSQTTNETVQGNLATFTKIVINDFDGVFLSRNRGTKTFGQFNKLPTLSFTGNAETSGPLILTGTSLRSCFLFCNNFNENLNNWDFSKVINIRGMFYGLPNSDEDEYKFTKGSASPELEDYLSINTASIAPIPTSYTIKVRQRTDEDGLIIFTHLDFFTSQNHLDLLKVGGEASLEFNNDVSFEFDITNVTFSGKVAQEGATTSNAEWTFTVTSKPTTSGDIPNESEVEFNWECTPFNKFNNGGVQPDWDTKKVTNMALVFYFQNELNFEFLFDTLLVTDVSFMFNSCTKFNNGDLPGSSTKPLTLVLPEAVDLGAMFQLNTTFNQTVTLTAPKATDVNHIFHKCTVFNNGDSPGSFTKPLFLNLPEATNLRTMFQLNTAFNQTVTLTAPKATDVSFMFNRCTSFNNGDSPGSSTKPLTLDLPEAVVLEAMFQLNTAFNQTVTLTSPKAENLRGMFWGCEVFNNGDLPGSFTKPLTLNLPEAVVLKALFELNTVFNQTVGLTAPKATDVSFMFWGCEVFNNGDSPGSSTKPLTLDLPEAVNLLAMFAKNTAFNQTVTLTAPKAENLRDMFWGSTSFNNGGQSLTLDLPEATDLSYMFSSQSGNNVFNQTVSLIAPKAQTLISMFWTCTVFNNGGQPLTLDLPEATDLSFMFLNNTAFNQTVTLTAPKAKNLAEMFYNCTAFNNGGQNFTNKDGDFWKISKVTTMEDLFFNVPLSNSIYSNFLIGCADQKENIQIGVKLNANLATPIGDGVTAKTTLNNQPYSWVITDATG